MKNFIMIKKDLLNLGIKGNALAVYLKMLDRYNLSRKNNWRDKEGKIYIIMKRDEICRDFNISKRTASSILGKLEEAALIVRRKQGLGKPSCIYINTILNSIVPNDEDCVNSQNEDKVNYPCPTCDTADQEEFYMSFFDNLNNVITEEIETNRTDASDDLENKKCGELNFQKCEKLHLQKCKKLHLNNNININNNIYNISISTDEIEHTIKKNINYDHQEENLKLLSNVIVEVAKKSISAGKDIFIRGCYRKYSEICERFLALSERHVEYIANCMSKLSEAPRDMFRYVRSCMFNAPLTIDLYSNTWGKCAQKQVTGFNVFEQKKLDDELDEMEELLLMEVNR